MNIYARFFWLILLSTLSTQQLLALEIRTIRLINNSSAEITIETKSMHANEDCDEGQDVMKRSMEKDVSIDLLCGAQEDITAYCVRHPLSAGPFSQWQKIECHGHWANPILKLNIFGR